MTAKFSASADGTKVNIGNAAENALQIDSTAKTIKALAPYILSANNAVFGATTALQTYIATVGTWTKCTFNVEQFDTAGAYDPTTSRFTCPKTGYYLFTASIRSSLQSTGNFLLGFGVDGSNVGSGVQVPNNGQAATISRILALSAGNTVEVQGLLSGSAAAGDIGVDFAFAHFDGTLLRES